MAKTTYNNLRVKHPTPIDPRTSVDTLLTITTYPTKYFSENMLIFVRDEKCFYFKNNSSIGDDVSHWTKLQTSVVTFEAYDSALTYEIATPVHVGSAMYVSNQAINIGEDPISTPNKWTQIGASNSFTATVTNLSDQTFTHAISNPVFSAWDGVTGANVSLETIMVDSTHLRVKSNPIFTGDIILK